MKAVVLIGGKQYLVEPGQTITTDHQKEKVGESVAAALILTTDDKGQISLGQGKVKATVAAHSLGPKLRVMKHHAKKHYRRTQGFRSKVTTLKIESIS